MSVTDKERKPWSTPCVGVCTATALGDKVCKGCKRTDEEIIKWNTLTNEEKIKINEERLKR